MKQARVESIMVITVACPTCGCACENASGSQMIEQGEQVTCPLCRQELTVPQSAFRVRTRRLIPRNEAAYAD